jgi:hypothetical protein
MLILWLKYSFINEKYWFIKNFFSFYDSNN